MKVVGIGFWFMRELIKEKIIMAKKTIKSSTAKGRLERVGEELVFQELDKNGNIINEISVMSFVDDYIGEYGVSMTIGFDKEF